jgi:hypothetical protein
MLDTPAGQPAVKLSDPQPEDAPDALLKWRLNPTDQINKGVIQTRHKLRWWPITR